MDFFTSIGRQHPATDRNRRNDFLQYSDEFTITKEKGLKGFNDQVSEIEIGSDLINEDSINQIKIQQRLLLCHNESIRKTNENNFDSYQRSFEDHRFESINNEDKNTNNPYDKKSSISSKLLMKQYKTPQFTKFDRYNSPNEKKQHFVSSLLIIKSKETHSYMMVKLTELKKIKSEIKEYLVQQQRNIKRILETYKEKLEIQITRQFKSFALSQQPIIRGNSSKHHHHHYNYNQTSEQLLALRQKLTHSQQLLRQLSIQLQSTRQQNDFLQQKLFDLEQKMVGVDLQVEMKFDQKKKQLQTKITQDVLSKYQSQLNHSTVDSSYGQQCVNTTTNNQVLIINLTNQNKYLEGKVKEYEEIIGERDNLKKEKYNLQQMLIQLKNKQKQIQAKQKDVDQSIKQIQKKSIDLERYQQSLQQKLKQFQEKLNLKQRSLQKRELSLQQKTNTINIPKVKISPKVETQRHYKTQHSDESNKISYDPKKHLKTELFDLNQREKFFTTTGETNSFKQKQNQTERNLLPQKSFDSTIIGHNNKGSYGIKADLSKNCTSSIRRLQTNRINQPSTEMKQINVSIYRPSTPNSYKYEPQYINKSPSPHITSHKTFHIDGYRKVSPRQRDNIPTTTTTYNKNTTNRLINDYRNGNYQPSNDKSTISKSSIDNSFISGQSRSTHKIAYQGYDMKKSKMRNQIINRNDLGKIQFLKSELKGQIDNIL